MVVKRRCLFSSGFEADTSWDHGRQCIPEWQALIGANAMRSLLALGLLIALSASANAATVHYSHKHHQFIPRSVTVATPPDLYCLQGVIWGYPGNCQFSTYDQCMASASGTVAYCDVNPQHLFAEQRRGYWPPR
jgi:hypothetical protein